MKLPEILSLSHYSRPANILVIGCGGTGAYIISHLSRIISTLDYEIKLYIADGDVVEEKNLKRQHFIYSDITKNKAVALTERYSSAFGININAITKDIEKIGDINSILKENLERSNILIGCIDNNATRKLISQWFYGYGSCERFWIDSGNEDRNGQVVCGFGTPTYLPYGSQVLNKSKKAFDGLFSLPCVCELYPEILRSDDKFNSELSCAERAISAPQNMQTNVTAATLALNYIQKILFNIPITSHAVEFSIDNIFSTKLNMIENLNKIDISRIKYWEFDKYPLKENK